MIQAAQQLAQQQAAQAPRVTQPAGSQQPGGSHGSGSSSTQPPATTATVMQAIDAWACRQSAVTASPAWRQGLQNARLADAPPVVCPIGEVRRILGAMRSRIEGHGKGHLAVST